MTLFVGWQVFTRFVLNWSNAWTEPAAIMLMSWFIFLGSAVGIRENYHLGFDVLLYVLPRNGKKYLRTISDLVVLAFAIGMIVLTLPLVLLLKRHMDRIVRALHEQITQLAETARGVVEGVGASFGGAPSIRSFIEARLHRVVHLRECARDTRQYGRRHNHRKANPTPKNLCRFQCLFHDSSPSAGRRLVV